MEIEKGLPSAANDELRESWGVAGNAQETASGSPNDSLEKTR
jgi:hypothetical protein